LSIEFVDDFQNLAQTNQRWANLVSWAGISVPIVLVFLTALIRSIVKRNNFFSGENLFLGIDLCFAGLAVSLVECLDLIHTHLLSANDAQFTKVLTSLAMCFADFVLLLVVTKLHQSCEVPTPRTTISGRVKAARDQERIDRRHRNKRIFCLGIVSNGVGVVSIAVFAWLHARSQV